MLFRRESQLSICGKHRVGVIRLSRRFLYITMVLRMGLFYVIASENTRENIDSR
jgi:hypothetical protein